VYGQGLVHYAVNNLAVSVVAYIAKAQAYDLAEEDLYGYADAK
jgi:hypothetical protein